MKSFIYSLIYLTLIAILFVSCENKEDNKPIKEPIYGEIKASLIQNSDCKHLDKSRSEFNFSTNESCVIYQYDESKGILSLTHVNAGFNCALTDLNIEIEVEGTSITIYENETNASADCQCLYDLDIELTSIAPQQYQFIFVEPYIQRQEALNFSIDLSEISEGEVCVPRVEYPWGI